MAYRVEFESYQRPFKFPLKTHYGWWEVRSGILIKLTHANGQTGWGEIAPLEWFGSESLAQALAFCQALPAVVSEDDILGIPDYLPACQFGFESAAAAITLDDSENWQSLSYSALLPTGIAALSSWPALWQQGYRTFKWKIGVATIAQEQEIFTQLLAQLPSEVILRLDANGGLNRSEAVQWLELCADQPVEFLEQPLPVGEFAAMKELSQHFTTPVALDESIATLTHLKTCYDQGWRGIFVIKPAIVGSPRRLRQFCQHHPIDAVFSTVFETAIGRQAGLKLAAELGRSQRAVGYGTTHWFEEDNGTAGPLEWERAQ
jgi:o-succinylbenzoate synthase